MWHVYRTNLTPQTLRRKHGGGSVMLWDGISLAGSWHLWASSLKYSDILLENLFQTAWEKVHILLMMNDGCQSEPCCQYNWRMCDTIWKLQSTGVIRVAWREFSRQNEKQRLLNCLSSLFTIIWRFHEDLKLSVVQKVFEWYNILKKNGWIE